MAALPVGTLVYGHDRNDSDGEVVQVLSPTKVLVSFGFGWKRIYTFRRREGVWMVKGTHPRSGQQLWVRSHQPNLPS